MKLKKYQIISIAVVFITILVVGFYVVRSMVYGKEPDIFIIWNILFTVIVSVNITLVNYPIFEKVKLPYSLRMNIFKRLILAFLVSSFTAAVIITIWVFIFYFIVNQWIHVLWVAEARMQSFVFDNIVVAVIVNFGVGAIMILQYTIVSWKKAFIETEQFKRISIESQYSALVNQINPHFLFNSMNALASLIPQSSEKAVEFVNKFSSMYRYVLDVKDKIVCELKDEIDFLNSYCYLQKIRFGENLLIEKQIDITCMNYFLPPLSLQLLVENAIKHNEISKSHPLKVTIESKEQFIIVRNNLKLKYSKQDSTGIGLNNLKERYEHLCDIMPEFYIKNDKYIAKVPLIKEE